MEDMTESHLVTDTHFTNATLTIRCVKSFEYRTVKNLVLRDINLKATTGGQLLEQALQAIKTAPGFKPFVNVPYDSLKIHHIAHTSKTTDVMIIVDRPELVLKPDQILFDAGVRHETEITLYCNAHFEEYKKNPGIKLW